MGLYANVSIFPENQNPPEPCSCLVKVTSIRLTADAIREIDAPRLNSGFAEDSIKHATFWIREFCPQEWALQGETFFYQTFLHMILRDTQWLLYHVSRKKFYSAIGTQTQYLHSKANWTEASVLFCLYNHGILRFLSLEIFNLTWSLFNQDYFYSIIIYYICQLIWSWNTTPSGKMQDVSHIMHKEMAVSLKWEFAKIKHFLQSACVVSLATSKISFAINALFDKLGMHDSAFKKGIFTDMLPLMVILSRNPLYSKVQWLSRSAYIVVGSLKIPRSLPNPASCHWLSPNPSLKFNSCIIRGSQFMKYYVLPWT